MNRLPMDLRVLLAIIICVAPLSKSMQHKGFGFPKHLKSQPHRMLKSWKTLQEEEHESFVDQEFNVREIPSRQLWEELVGPNIYEYLESGKTFHQLADVKLALYPATQQDIFFGTMFALKTKNTNKVVLQKISSKKQLQLTLLALDPNIPITILACSKWIRDLDPAFGELEYSPEKRYNMKLMPVDREESAMIMYHAGFNYHLRSLDAFSNKLQGEIMWRFLPYLSRTIQEWTLYIYDFESYLTLKSFDTSNIFVQIDDTGTFVGVAIIGNIVVQSQEPSSKNLEVIKEFLLEVNHFMRDWPTLIDEKITISTWLAALENGHTYQSETSFAVKLSRFLEFQLYPYHPLLLQWVFQTQKRPFELTVKLEDEQSVHDALCRRHTCPAEFTQLIPRKKYEVIPDRSDLSKSEFTQLDWDLDLDDSVTTQLIPRKKYEVIPDRSDLSKSKSKSDGKKWGGISNFIQKLRRRKK